MAEVSTDSRSRSFLRSVGSLGGVLTSTRDGCVCTGTLEQELASDEALFCSYQDRHTESEQSRTGKSAPATALSWQNKSVGP